MVYDDLARTYNGIVLGAEWDKEGGFSVEIQAQVGETTIRPRMTLPDEDALKWIQAGGVQITISPRKIRRRQKKAGAGDEQA